MRLPIRKTPGEKIFGEISRLVFMWNASATLAMEGGMEGGGVGGASHSAPPLPEVEREATLPDESELRREVLQLQIELAAGMREKEELLLRNEELFRQKEAAEREARVDDLTKLSNLRDYEERVEEEIRRVERTGRLFSLLMIDIDNFKSINDGEGHATGDSVLRTVANILKEETRSQDVAARIGGEEFVVLMPETTMQEAEKVSQRIVLAIEKGSKEKGHPPVTVSGGYAEWGPEMKSKEGLKKAADAALYQAKASGKNKALPYAKGRRLDKAEVMEQAQKLIKRNLPAQLSPEDRVALFRQLLAEAETEAKKE